MHAHASGHGADAGESGWTKCDQLSPTVTNCHQMPPNATTTYYAVLLARFVSPLFPTTTTTTTTAHHDVHPRDLRHLRGTTSRSFYRWQQSVRIPRYGPPEGSSSPRCSSTRVEAAMAHDIPPCRPALGRLASGAVGEASIHSKWACARQVIEQARPGAGRSRSMRLSVWEPFQIHRAACMADRCAALGSRGEVAGPHEAHLPRAPF